MTVNDMDAATTSTTSAPVGGPMRRVLAAITDGATSRREIVDRTQLSAPLVDAIIDELLRLGRLGAEQLAGGCPTNGCGSCPMSRADRSAGCVSAGSSAPRGPVALTLRQRPNL
ncbi:hypothetical protein EG850_05265 [Gulosibacter macacae]|uniref:Transcriptional regulator HTH-type FeoC domain-containing protein n=1 Tax=Gulosibacter macacae TaxID=2488791 RepID=A0A3P3VY50_9MICO|nr:hypothetical protein [Gulosibacter macacae]RRJ87227.1 hypothetical protein EG850_05265 [Gulosibacter macacae]